MTLQTDEAVPTQTLGLPEELILMLLNEETGYFHQVPGWHLNCAIAGAALAELSLQARIDTDTNRLILLDATPTESPVLDLALAQISRETADHDARYWVEKLAANAEMMVDLTLDLLVRLGILEHHAGGFWSLSPSAWYDGASDDNSSHYVKTRISRAIFLDEIPSPRDVIVVALANTCDVLRHVYALDDTSDARVQLISQMDLIGRAIADAVSGNILRTLARSTSLTRKIPTVPLRRVGLNRHIRRGNIPAAFADFANEYGPVFQINSPLSLDPMIFLVGSHINRWVHRHSRMYLDSGSYLRGLESAYHASGLLPSLDGADHFRLRKSLRASYSRSRLENSISTVYDCARQHMASWKVGDAEGAVTLARNLMNAVLPPYLVGVNTDDVFDDLVDYKIRALKTQVVNVLPKWLLKTPGMKRKAKSVDVLRDRIVDSHTPALRSGCPRDHADDVLSLHHSDPTFLPEANLRFQFSAPTLAAVYAGDQLSFMLYAMVSQPEMYELIQEEATSLFADGDPLPADFLPSSLDVTSRFMMECLRLYPTVAMSVRNVVNTCVVDGYELPLGARVHLAQTSTHYMDDLFPDPHKFDIDRYLPSRGEHRTPGYAPYGLGTHSCMGSQLVELLLAVCLTMMAHHYTFEIRPANYKLKIDPFPSMCPKKRFKLKVVEQRHEIPVEAIPSVSL